MSEPEIRVFDSFSFFLNSYRCCCRSPRFWIVMIFIWNLLIRFFFTCPCILLKCTAQLDFECVGTIVKKLTELSDKLSRLVGYVKKATKPIWRRSRVSVHKCEGKAVYRESEREREEKYKPTTQKLVLFFILCLSVCLLEIWSGIEWDRERERAHKYR